MPKTTQTTQCGVKVSTWGSDPNGGNGILHYLDSTFFGSNVGHASVTLTLPADDPKTKVLLEQYCTNPKIPYEKKTVTVQQAVLDPITGKFKKGETIAHTEEIYEVYFSWFPGKSEKYYLNSEPMADNITERIGVNFEWNSKLPLEIDRYKRYHHGRLGGKTMTYGPLTVVHPRGLAEKEEKKIIYKTAKIEIEETKESLNKLIEKLKTPKNISFNDEILLDRFTPNWRSTVQNSQIITDMQKQELTSEAELKMSELLLAIENMETLSFQLGIYENFLDITKGTTNDYIKQTITDYESELKLLKDQIKTVLPSIEFPETAFDMDTPLDEQYVTLGKPPDNTVNLPLSVSFLPKETGHENGLDPEEILKKMQELVALDAEGFNLTTKNCSKTVGSILEAGAKNQPAVKKIFQNKAFGFFGNPQEVYNNSIKAQQIIYDKPGKTKSFLTSLNIKPIERMGGYLIGVWMGNSGKLTAPIFFKKTGVILAGMIVGPLALAGFTVRKLLNPLESFKGAIGLIKFTFTRNSKILQGLGIAILAPVALALSPLAAVQFGAKKILVDPIKKLFKPSNKKLKRLEQELKTPKELQELDNNNTISKALKNRIVELNSKPKDALADLMNSLEQNQNNIPILTKAMSTRLLKYLKTRPNEANIYQKICKQTRARVKKVQEEPMPLVFSKNPKKPTAEPSIPPEREKPS